MLPSSSWESVASNATSSGGVPELGVAVNDATGRTFSGSLAVIVVVDCPCAPWSSVTVSVTVYAPAVS